MPCCIAFATTDYKAQGRAFNNIILDLQSAGRKTAGHRTYTAVYVALSRCRSLSGLNLLCTIPQAIFLQDLMIT